MRHSEEIKQKALMLHLEYHDSVAVGKELGIPPRTVRDWVNALPKAAKVVKEPVVESTVNRVIDQQLHLNINNGTIMVFSDAHILPHQPWSVAAEAFLKVSQLVKPDIVINGGDTFDFSSISKHDALGWDPQFSVKDEIEAGVEYLNEVASITSNAQHFMIEGNHDTRYNKFLRKHLPQFQGVVGMDFRDQLPKDWRYTMSIMINEAVLFLHAINGGVHAGYNNVLKSGISVVTGHTHQLEVKPFSDYRGTRFGVQTGTLATIKGNPLFNYTMNSPLNWQAGFVVLTFVDGELQYPEVCSVNANNKAIFRGKVL